jgi:DNA-directed RNA polymerase specialized sigma24 family protein
VQEHPNVEVFTAFAREVEPRLRYALVAGCGPEKGLEATEETLVYAWEHWDKVENAGNPAGLLYRVGMRKARRMRKPLPLYREPPVTDPDPPEPGLVPALDHLSKQQRIAVVLIDGFGSPTRRAPISSESEDRPSRSITTVGWRSFAESWG